MNKKEDMDAKSLEATVDQLRMIDDELMRTALQDQVELVEYVLRIIMRKPALRIIRMETQKDLRQLVRGRSLILDVWAVDAGGTQYNIEIQRAEDGADPRRPRYHHSLLDATNAKRGKDVKELPKTCVVFITETDCIGDGNLLDHFCWRSQNGRVLDTGQEILYLNTAYAGIVQPEDEQLAALAHDFRCQSPSDMKLGPIEERVRFLKETPEGRAQVSEAVRQLMREDRKREKGKIARKLHEGQKYTDQEIADLLELTLEDVQDACGTKET